MNLFNFFFTGFFAQEVQTHSVPEAAAIAAIETVAVLGASGVSGYMQVELVGVTDFGGSGA